MLMLEQKKDVDYTGYSLYKKVLAVMGMVEYLEYDGEVKFGTTKYSYLSETKITTVLREAMIRVGLVMFPVGSKPAQFTIDGRAITQCTMTYRIFDTDNENNYIDIEMTGFGRDNMDKGILKAQTAAFKYAQRQAFMIPTGEDPDKISSAELTDQANKKKTADKKKAVKKKIKEQAEQTQIDYNSDIRKFERKSWRAEETTPNFDSVDVVSIADPIVDAIASINNGENGITIAEIRTVVYKDEAVLTLTMFPNDKFKDIDAALQPLGFLWCRAGKSSHWFHPDGPLNEINFPSGSGFIDGVTAIISSNGEILGELTYSRTENNNWNATFTPTKNFNREINIWESFFITSVLDRRIENDANAIKEGRQSYDTQFEYETDYDDNGNLLIMHWTNVGGERLRTELESSLRWTLDKMNRSL